MTIQIPVEELLYSLESGYTEYKTWKASGASEVDLAHVKGFCTTIEQILAVYSDVTAEDIKKIKMPIIGNESLKRKKRENKEIDLNADLDLPTILRRVKVR